ncbi:MAG TPA: hypothetical protein VGC91_04890 [Pyrinomonadaceae bacterium]|jgi:hypothetical protein
MTTEEHNRTLGILHLVYGGLHALIALMMIGFFAVISAGIGASGGKGAPEVAAAMTIFWAIFSFIMMLFAVPSFVAGYGLLKKKSWTKIWAIIAGGLAGLSFPLGTALCVYTFWFLFGNGGKELYDGLGQQSNPYQPGVLHGAPQAADWNSRTRAREYNYSPPPEPPDWRGE